MDERKAGEAIARGRLPKGKWKKPPEIPPPKPRDPQLSLGFDRPAPPEPTTIGGPDGWRRRPCFYVAVRSGVKFGLLLGPFPAMAEAEGWMDRAKGLAERCDPFSWFYTFGTARVEDGEEVGRLNDLAGLVIAEGKRG